MSRIHDGAPPSVATPMLLHDRTRGRRWRTKAKGALAWRRALMRSGWSARIRCDPPRALASGSAPAPCCAAGRLLYQEVHGVDHLRPGRERGVRPTHGEVGSEEGGEVGGHTIRDDRPACGGDYLAIGRLHRLRSPLDPIWGEPRSAYPAALLGGERRRITGPKPSRSRRICSSRSSGEPQAVTSDPCAAC